MIKDIWDSFKDNVKERTTNPFLGTLIIVWIVHNWPVVYAFFYFDKDWKLQQKIDYFNKYWSQHNFFWNLVGVAFVAIGILIITYLFLGLSRFLSNYFENIVVPFVYSLTKGKTVTAETHQQALDQIEKWKTRFEEERKAKVDAQEERDELEKKLFTSDELPETDLTSFQKLFLDISQSFKKDEFEKTILDISKSSGFKANEPIIDFLLKNGLIEFERKRATSASTTFYYKFTSLGNEFKKEYFQSF